jgi:four helix bundle protein
MSIALKETNETDYWLQLIKEGNYVSQIEFESVWRDCDEKWKILVSIVKSAKENNKK